MNWPHLFMWESGGVPRIVSLTPFDPVLKTSQSCFKCETSVGISTPPYALQAAIAGGFLMVNL